MPSITLHRVPLLDFLLMLEGCRSGKRKTPPPPVEVAVLTTLRGGRIIPFLDLVASVYADDPEGGPPYAEDTVRLTIHRLRKAGVPIETHGWRGYRISDEGGKLRHQHPYRVKHPPEAVEHSQEGRDGG